MGTNWPKNRKWPSARNREKMAQKREKKKRPQIPFFRHFWAILGRGPFSIFWPVFFPFLDFGPFSILHQAASLAIQKNISLQGSSHVWYLKRAVQRLRIGTDGLRLSTSGKVPHTVPSSKHKYMAGEVGSIGPTTQAGSRLQIGDVQLHSVVKWMKRSWSSTMSWHLHATLPSLHFLGHAHSWHLAHSNPGRRLALFQGKKVHLK